LYQICDHRDPVFRPGSIAGQASSSFFILARIRDVPVFSHGRFSVSHAVCLPSIPVVDFVSEPETSKRVAVQISDAALPPSTKTFWVRAGFQSLNGPDHREEGTGLHGHKVKFFEEEFALIDAETVKIADGWRKAVCWKKI